MISHAHARVVLVTAMSMLGALQTAGAADRQSQACTDDVMIVFDASKSMAASDDSAAGLRRIDTVRTALAKVVRKVPASRRLGLVTYDTGERPACSNINLEMLPQAGAAQRLMERVNALRPDGRTPLTSAVALAARVLGFRRKPGTIVVVTDGDETCHGDPCALAERLKAEAAGLVVHVIGYRLKGSLGSSGRFQSRCLADTTGGLYVSTDTSDELVAALEKTLSCPLLSSLEPRR